MGSRRLLTVGFCFLLLLPDADKFAIGFANYSSLVERVSGLDSDRIIAWLGQLVSFLLFPIAIRQILATSAPRATVVITVIAMIMAVSGCFLLINDGYSIFRAPRVPILVSLYVFSLIAITVSTAPNLRGLLTDIYIGLTAVAATKLAYSLYNYFTSGGIEFVQGVNSLAADGGLLTLWCLVACAAFGFGVESLVNRKPSQMIVRVVLAVIFTVAIAATFRRNIAIRVFGVTVAVSAIYYWLRGRGGQGLKTITAFGIGLAIVFLSGMLFAFGIDVTIDRIRSLSIQSESEFGASNASYVDDWQAWPKAVFGNLPIGSGPGQAYGISRINDQMDEEGGVIPLHTGVFETWASFGIIGVLFHALTFVGVPLLKLKAARHTIINDSSRILVAIAGGYTLFIGLWPFGPPFLVNVQASGLLALCLGTLIHPSHYSVGIASRSSVPAKQMA